MEVHNQLRNDLSNRERKMAIRNHASIHATIIISVMNITVGNQINASDVYQRIISSQIYQKLTLWIKNVHWNTDNRFHWNTEKTKTRAYRKTKIDKTSDNSTDQIEPQKIYTSMACMSSNAEICPKFINLIMGNN